MPARELFCHPLEVLLLYEVFEEITIYLGSSVHVELFCLVLRSMRKLAQVIPHCVFQGEPSRFIQKRICEQRGSRSA